MVGNSEKGAWGRAETGNGPLPGKLPIFAVNAALSE
jgi:hypothetical protein